VDLSGLDARTTETHFVCATDVDNPVLGPLGSAAVFGPQKGATPRDIETIESALVRLVHVTGSAALASLPGTGAAGATAFAAMLALNARIVSGAQFVASATGLAERIPVSRALLVGEGKLDSQTLAGKGPAYVARMAAALNVPSYAIAGQIELNRDELSALGIGHAVALADLAPSVGEAIRHPNTYIEQAARILAASLS
jgi:glycerate kinase